MVATVVPVKMATVEMDSSAQVCILHYKSLLYTMHDTFILLSINME